MGKWIIWLVGFQVDSKNRMADTYDLISFNMECRSVWTYIILRIRWWEIVFVVNLNLCVLWSCDDVNTKIWREFRIKGLPDETNIKVIYSYVEIIIM